MGTVDGIEVESDDLDLDHDDFDLPNDWYVNYSHNYGVKSLSLQSEHWTFLIFNFSIILSYNSDPEWRMEDHVPSDTMNTESELPQSVDPSQERAYWVFKSALLSLFVFVEYVACLVR